MIRSVPLLKQPMVVVGTKNEKSFESVIRNSIAKIMCKHYSRVNVDQSIVFLRHFN